MKGPKKKGAPGPQTGSAENITLTPNHTPPTTTSNATAFGVALDRPSLTTTRRCEGSDCWCQVGSTIAWPLTHDQEMARMFREIRRIEVAGGVLGL